MYSRVFALRISTVLLGLEPPTMRFLFETKKLSKVTVSFLLVPEQKGMREKVR